MDEITIKKAEYERLLEIEKKYTAFVKKQSSGGKKSSANMTPEQRRERAIKAARARAEKQRLKKLQEQENKLERI